MICMDCFVLCMLQKRACLKRERASKDGVLKRQEVRDEDGHRYNWRKDILHLSH